ncbi:rhomboid family intramembrane serine protease [Candidatus Woesearchaeota archaeon]|nr:rhomboid family intramembrane serine protease [Candidatus Woesearchaeota archaeon]
MEQNRRYALWLTGIIAAVFALQVIFPAVTYNFRLVSADAWSRPWTLLTAIFLHGSITHLLFNGFGLAMFGSILEQTIGSRRFLLVFFGTGLLSSIASTFFYNAVVGASGAIFGVIGALVILRPTLTVWVYYIPMPLYMAAVVWAAGDLFGFIVPTGIANAGHLAGLAAGLAAGFIMRGRKRFSIGSGGSRERVNVLTAEEFDRWERENMRKGKQ